MKAITALFFFPLCCFLASSAFAQSSRHHIGTAAGYFRITDDQLENPLTGLNLRNNGIGSLSYRYSASRSLDLVLEAHQTIARDSFGVSFFPGFNPGVRSIDVQGKLSNIFLGGGFRINAPLLGLRPYLQGNLYFVRQKIDVEKENISVKDDDNALGFGASAGMEVYLSRLISIPVEFNLLHAGFIDRAKYLLDANGNIVGFIPSAGMDVSGFGLSAGVNFNFGRPRLQKPIVPE